MLTELYLNKEFKRKMSQSSSGDSKDLLGSLIATVKGNRGKKEVCLQKYK